MSHSGKNNNTTTTATNITELGFHNLSFCDDALSCEANKPDFRELDLGSPVSPLRTRPSGLTATSTTTTTTTSSSSSSSGSVSGQTRLNPVNKRHDSIPNSHSGELSGSSETSPTAPTRKPGHARSDSGSVSVSGHPLIYSGQSSHQSSVSSPPPNVLPTGNICPSGKILKTGIGLTSNRSSRTDTLGSGMGHYGHGSIMRGGSNHIVGGGSATSIKSGGSLAVGPENANVNRNRGGICGGDAEELKRMGNELYRKACFGEALSMYDKAISLAPGNAAFRSNRAAALTGLGRIGEAVKECEEAVRLDPNYWRAHQRLGSLLVR